MDGKRNEILKKSTVALMADSNGYKFLRTGVIISSASASVARIKLNIWVSGNDPYWDRWDDISWGRLTGVAGGWVTELAVGSLRLLANAPNPFSEITNIGCQIH